MKKKEIKKILNQLDRIELPDKKQILSVCRETPVNECLSEASKNVSRIARRYILAICMLMAVVPVLALWKESNETNQKESNATKRKVTVKKVEENQLSPNTPVSREAVVGEFSPDKLQEGEHLTMEMVKGIKKWLKETELDRIGFYSNKLAFDESSDTSYYTGYIADIQGSYESYFESIQEDVLSKYKGNQKVWSVTFDKFAHSRISDCIVLEDGVAVCGCTFTTDEEFESQTWAALVSGNGKILWQIELDGLGDVIADSDGLAIFNLESVDDTDGQYLNYCKYDMNGNLISNKKIYETFSREIVKVIKCNDGYILQLDTELDGIEVIRVQRDGTITERYEYHDPYNLEKSLFKSSSCYFTDVAEYNGKIYISAYRGPYRTSRRGYVIPHVFNQEAVLVLHPFFQEKSFELTKEQLTKQVKSNYAAMLFVCDPATGEFKPQQVVEGAVGGVCSIGQDGHLVWDVEQIKSAYLSFEYNQVPHYIGGFYIGGESGIARFIYDSDGNLLNQQETGEVVKFRR